MTSLTSRTTPENQMAYIYPTTVDAYVLSTCTFVALFALRIECVSIIIIIYSMNAGRNGLRLPTVSKLYVGTLCYADQPDDL